MQECYVGSLTPLLWSGATNTLTSWKWYYVKLIILKSCIKIAKVTSRFVTKINVKVICGTLNFNVDAKIHGILLHVCIIIILVFHLSVDGMNG